MNLPLDTDKGMQPDNARRIDGEKEDKSYFSREITNKKGDNPKKCNRVTAEEISFARRPPLSRLVPKPLVTMPCPTFKRPPS